MDKKKRVALRVVGGILIPIGIFMIVLGCTVLAYHPFGNEWFSKQPRMAVVIPGAFICFLGLAAIAGSFAKTADESTIFTIGGIVPGGAAGTHVTEKPADKNDEPRNTRCTGCGAPITKQSEKFCNFCGTKL